MNIFKIIFALVIVGAGLTKGATLDERIADRAAIERVYYAHRTGVTETFEQALPAAELHRLIKRDVARESALRSHYGVEITAAQIAAEVTRIETTTRDPETLAEIKAALGQNATHFADAFAKPIVVERELRARFDNDDALHAAARRECEATRTNLLAAKISGATAAELSAQLKRTHTTAVSQATWSFLARTVETNTPASVGKLYFDELPSQLRQVLAAQLRVPGDVSAVIETPENFLLFITIEKTEAALTAACLTLPKQNLDAWLGTQPFETEK